MPVGLKGSPNNAPIAFNKRFVERTGCTKVKRYDLIVLTIGINTNPVISEMRIGLNQIPFKKLGDKQFGKALSQSISAALRQGLNFFGRNGIPRLIACCQHTLGTKFGVHLGHNKTWVISQPVVKRLGEFPLLDIIAFTHKHIAQFIEHIGQIKRFGSQASRGNQARQGAYVSVNGVGHTRVLNLDHNLLTSGFEGGQVSLPQGCSSNWLSLNVELCNCSFTERVNQLRFNKRPTNCGSVVLKCGQDLHSLFRQKILPIQREHLPGLHDAAFQTTQFIGQFFGLGAVKISIGFVFGFATAKEIAHRVACNFCTGTYTHPCQGYVAFKGAGFNAVHGAAIGISLGMGFCVVRFVLLSHAAKGPCEYKVSWATL